MKGSLCLSFTGVNTNIRYLRAFRKRIRKLSMGHFSAIEPRGSGDWMEKGENQRRKRSPITKQAKMTEAIPFMVAKARLTLEISVGLTMMCS